MTAANLLPSRRGLDAAGVAGFGGRVRSIVKHILIAALFAVAMLGGAELPILHAPQFAKAHALAHQHMDHAKAAHHDHAAVDLASGTDHGDPGNSGGTDRGCHAHAHCCAATAILTVCGTQPLIATLALSHRERKAALPYGQLSNPPLRPPRLVA
ncbi:MAG: hypothetical protein Q8K85_11025 [Hyphomicrobium sp.]|nr:hypothetical protein [Hyphomicrobium sp.]